MTRPNGDQIDLNTILMRSTFKIAGKEKLGTVFIIGNLFLVIVKNSIMCS